MRLGLFAIGLIFLVFEYKVEFLTLDIHWLTYASIVMLILICAIQDVKELLK